jgi:hypothetical protein
MPPDSSPTLTPKGVVESYRRAKEMRTAWEAHWQECYDYALPQRNGAIRAARPGEKKTDKLFDATATDAVDQLAASLLAEMTPPWSRWFGLTTGAEATPEDTEVLAPELEKAAAALQSHFDLSNFSIEVHQCYLDLITAGSACLLFEEAEPGEASAFRFTAIPLSQVVLEEGPSGRLDTTYRRSHMTRARINARFPKATLPETLLRREDNQAEPRVAVIEAVVPDKAGFAYMAVAEQDRNGAGEPLVLDHGRFVQSPFINFRWLKAPGETYGRSPVMKALPDIKTANKVVELVLKNASIAVTGIWQAEDDGVLNPANIKLVPGTIIPKAVGSAGLTPLAAPGRFDVSQLVLDDLRGNIRKALLADKLGQPDSPRMSATEVLERSADMSRMLGATYGRLQSELLTPLITRAMAILGRRGEIENIRIDGRIIDLEYKSPLARNQARREAQDTLLWLNAVGAMGPEAQATIDQAAAVRWLGKAFGVPSELMRRGQTALPALADPGELDGGAPELVADGLSDLMALATDALPELAEPEFAKPGQAGREATDDRQ